MDFGLRGRVALVFGGSSGIGRGIASVLVREGARVVICARDEERLNKAAREIGAIGCVRGDLSVVGEARRVVEEVITRFGRVDVLVTNTGGPAKGTFTDISREDWLAGYQSLWLSAVEAMQAVLPRMGEAQFGRIMLVTSVAAKEPIPKLTVSNGLRAGLLGLVRSLSHEVAANGITVNAILPGYTKTERLEELGISEEKLTSGIPARRLARPDELGALAAFLASEQAGYITGQAIAVDGGVMRGI